MSCCTGIGPCVRNKYKGGEKIYNLFTSAYDRQAYIAGVRQYGAESARCAKGVRLTDELFDLYFENYEVEVDMKCEARACFRSAFLDAWVEIEMGGKEEGV